MSATSVVHGRESVTLASGLVTASVCLEGGQMAPVTFRLNGREVSPYSLSPWLPDEVDSALPVLLRNLRGDFWCLPFGPQDDGPPHGDPANQPWKVLSAAENRIVMEIHTSDSKGRIEKEISTRPDETAIYAEHRVSGVDGSFSYGNHPILDLSGLPEGAGRISVSPFRWGSVYQPPFPRPPVRPNGSFRGLPPKAKS